MSIIKSKLTTKEIKNKLKYERAHKRKDQKQIDEWNHRGTIEDFLSKHINVKVDLLDKIFIDDPNLYRNFLQIINEILYLITWYRYFEKRQNLINKYTKIKEEILNAQDPNAYVISLSKKYAKYQFKPELYRDKKYFLIAKAKFEFYCLIVNNGKNQIFEESNFKIVKNKQYNQVDPKKNWIIRKYNKVMESNSNCFLLGTKTYYEHKNDIISIDDNN
ncbi:6401_t:CDS:1, partial [Racocetra persica]